MTSSYQARKNEIANLKEVNEKEVFVKTGVMNIAGRLNLEKKMATSKMEGLFEIITKYGNEQALREAYKLIEQSVLVKYKAIRGKKTRKTKKGEVEYDCWVSVWGKFAGSIKNEEPPLCNGYIKYVNDDDFDYNKDTNTFIYKHSNAVLNSVEVVIVN